MYIYMYININPEAFEGLILHIVNKRGRILTPRKNIGNWC